MWKLFDNLFPHTKQRTVHKCEHKKKRVFIKILYDRNRIIPYAVCPLTFSIIEDSVQYY